MRNSRVWVIACLGYAGMAGAQAVALHAAPAPAGPPREGLALWLDAADLDGDGKADAAAPEAKGQAAASWADRSGGGLVARQEAPAARPVRVWDKAGRAAAVQFDGDDFLTLGRAESLRFASGKAFAVVAVFSAATAGKGTLVSWGGGSAGERGYQLWAAPGKIGGLRYSGLHEFTRKAGIGLAAMVCDGKQVRVLLNGREGASFAAGRARKESVADVLIGARRAGADGSGVGYPLTGDIREVLIYSRALPDADLAAITKYLAGKHDAADVRSSLETLDTRIRKLQAAGRSLDLAELLWQTATRNKLTDAQAEIAAKLLDDDDPFARGLAEWALARKVGFENNGQVARWPGKGPPAWFRKYMAVPQERRIEADWVRQAVARGVHRDYDALAGDVIRMGFRACAMEYRQPVLFYPPTCCDRIVALRNRIRRWTFRAPLRAPTEADLRKARLIWLEAHRWMRKLMLAQAAEQIDSLVIVTQFTPHTVRNITRSYAWKHKPGGDIVILDDLASGGQVRPVLDGRLGTNGDIDGYYRELQWLAD